MLYFPDITRETRLPPTVINGYIPVVTPLSMSGTLLIPSAPAPAPALGPAASVAERLAAAQQRVDELHDSLDELFAQLGEAGIARPKDTLLFVKNVQFKEGKGPQQLTCSCMFCNMRVVSTGATRVVDHLLACPLCPDRVKGPVRTLREGTQKKRKVKEEHSKMIRVEADQALQEAKLLRAEKRQQSLGASFNAAQNDVADAAIARFFYSNGLSFSAADSKPGSYYTEMVAAIRNTTSNYVAPNANKIAGPLLESCHTHMEANIKERDAKGQLSERFGVSVTSDGWEDTNGLSLINSAYIMANDGGVYLRSVDTSGMTKTAEYCANLMIEDIYAIGPYKVVCIVTDTCSTMKKMWSLVEKEFPWISSNPCQTHCSSLLMNDIAKLPESAQTLKEETLVVGWCAACCLLPSSLSSSADACPPPCRHRFSNHQKPLAYLREHVRNFFKGASKELKKAGATRMGSNTFVGERLEEVKPCLQSTVVDARYVAEKYEDKGDDRETSNCQVVMREHKGGTAKRLVLDDSGFWARVRHHVSLTMPICKLLRRHDTSAPSVGKVYHGWFEMGESINESSVPDAEAAQDKFTARWIYAHSDFFAAAYVVDPEFVDHEQASNEEVMQGFMQTLEKVAILLAIRKRQSDTGEYTNIWKERCAAIKADPTKQLKNFPIYPMSKTDDEVASFCAKATMQLSLYRGKKGTFAWPWVFKSAQDMPAYMWWDQHGSSVPELQAVARMVLAQPASASICERINSEFAFVKDRRRNRLSHERANKLVALFHNLRLLKRMKAIAYAEPAVGWSDNLERSSVTKFVSSQDKTSCLVPNL